MFKGREFESWHRLLDGHFTTFSCKKCNVCLKIPKINEKEAEVGQFEKILFNDIGSWLQQLFQL